MSLFASAKTRKGFAEIGGFGFAVIAVVALVTAFSELLPMLFGRPFVKWLATFVSLFVKV